MANPYRDKKDHCFWSRSITSIHHSEIDPFVGPVPIHKSDKVATMGSCFAQHLSRFIMVSGANYFVSETAPAGMESAEARRSNYGVFSARYGNVYTVEQAVQLFDRAYGVFAPAEDVWRRDNRFVDALRPQIEPQGFASEDEVRTERARHLEAVRTMFEQADWLVFTLGLTEAWRSKIDGAIFPITPGVAGGAYDPSRHEFVNFSAREVSERLQAFITRARSINPNLKFLLTVSPVPLIATYEDRHVLVSTTYSKAALRVAAEEAARTMREVVYFPSFEIITSPATCGYYYSDDLREVTDIGVAHVMRVFGKHFLSAAASDSTLAFAADETASTKTIIKDTAVVCDEELIEQSLRIGRS